MKSFLINALVFVVVVVSTTTTAASVTSLDPEEFEENLKDFVLERSTDQDLPTDLNESGLSGLPLPLIKQILYYSQPSWNRQSDSSKSKRGMSLEEDYPTNLKPYGRMVMVRRQASGVQSPKAGNLQKSHHLRML